MKNIKLLAVSALIGTSFVTGQMFAPSAGTFVGGTAQDPVVTETLMKQELGKLNNEITSLKNTITALENKVKSLSSNSGTTSGGTTSGGTTSGGTTSGGTTSGGTTTTTKTGVVTSTLPLNIRSGAGTSYSKVGTAPVGATVTILKTSGTWYQVKYGNITGWASASYIKVNTTTSGSTSSGSTSSGTTTTTKTAVVNAAAGLNIRSGASTSHTKIGSAPNGATVTIVSTSGTWYQIKYGNITGWVSGAYLVVK